MELRDNGRGFDPEARHDGIGLLGMKERVEGMGGRLFIQSASGGGTAISIMLSSTDDLRP
jgi:signal transduction histidine kinase